MNYSKYVTLKLKCQTIMTKAKQCVALQQQDFGEVGAFMQGMWQKLYIVHPAEASP